MEGEDPMKNFMDRSGADEQKAAFYLEAAGGDLEVALFNYLVTEAPSSPSAGASTDANSSVTIKKKSKSNTDSSQNTNFSTLRNLNRESSSDEEEGQAFYAGGSVRSGQQILGPGKNKHDIVSDMFRSVKEHGGLVLNQDANESGSSFSGTGYKLGATLDDTVVVPDPVKESKKSEPEPVVLRLWKNGFSLDNNELRPYDDPENAEFLKYVRRGEIPPELRSGSEIYLTMEDRRHEDFIKQSSGTTKPFTGKGHLLGSPAPAIIGSTVSQTVDNKDKEDNQKAAQEQLNINENEPVTVIQFRLADGSRISGRFNHTHTISHLRQYIISAVPIYQLQTFILLTTFPNKELTDDSQTIKDAGLLNALVVQRLK